MFIQLRAISWLLGAPHFYILAVSNKKEYVNVKKNKIGKSYHVKYLEKGII